MPEAYGLCWKVELGGAGAQNKLQPHNCQSENSLGHKKTCLKESEVNRERVGGKPDKGGSHLQSQHLAN